MKEKILLDLNSADNGANRMNGMKSLDSPGTSGSIIDAAGVKSTLCEVNS